MNEIIKLLEKADSMIKSESQQRQWDELLRFMNWSTGLIIMSGDEYKNLNSLDFLENSANAFCSIKRDEKKGRK